MDEIVNRVKESGLIPLDLGDFRWKNPIVGLDISGQLWQGFVLKEKDFRSWISTHDWSEYKGKAVFVHCSADAIIPTWAYMLIASRLLSEEVPFVIGNAQDLEKKLIHQAIEALDLADFSEGRIIIKGCADIADPAYAMTELMKRLQPVAKSIMYGEPCSTVPIFKRK
jgi:hypothetical protein